MTTLATIGTVLTVGSAVVGAGASIYGAHQQIQQGKAIEAEAERQAMMDELHGKNSYAASLREADLRRMEGKLIMSRQQAMAAASGAGTGADDPTLLKIMSETGANAEFGARSVIYSGESARDDYLNSATSRRISGRNNFIGSILSATGTLAGGIGRLADTSKDWIPAARRLAGAF